jgi:hypothetical protein
MVDKARLRDGDRVMLGHNCQLRFNQPVSVSTTARLEVVSGHRLPLALNGVLLMGDTLIIGPSGDGRMIIPDLRRSVVRCFHPVPAAGRQRARAWWLRFGWPALRAHAQ